MELDVRPIPRAQKHAKIFQTFTDLEVGQCFILLNDHDPVPLRNQFEVNFARSFTWEYDQSGPEIWRVRIAKTASTPLPQILTNTAEIAESTAEPDLTGAIWKIPVAERDLDANIISLPPGHEISAHAGPDLDIMFIVVSGQGTIGTELDSLQVKTGDVLWLPRHSQRKITAGAAGLRYLTVHKRKLGLQITSR